MSEAGRKRDDFLVSAYGCRPNEKTIGLCQDAGIDRLISTAGSAPRDEAIRKLDELAKPARLEA